MKKIKTTIAATMFCATAFAGYTACEQATMTDQEKIFLANLEALTGDEYESGFHGSSACASGTYNIEKGMLYMVCGKCPSMQYLTDRTTSNCTW